jgi:hypothetical protein
MTHGWRGLGLPSGETDGSEPPLSLPSPLSASPGGEAGRRLAQKGTPPGGDPAALTLLYTYYTELEGSLDQAVWRAIRLC